MKKKSSSVRWLVRAEGEVQGVGFRWTARREAEPLGIAGWAENAFDGSVNLVLEGRAETLHRYLLQLSVRFPDARFSREGAVPATGLQGFGIR